MKPIKVYNSSKYWTDFEAELSVFFHMKWVSKNAIEEFERNEFNLIKMYIKLTNKYGICQPLQNFSYEFEDSIYSLYLTNKKLVYPTKLFTNLEDSQEAYNVVSVDPLTFESQSIENFFSSPVRIDISKNKSEVKITIFISNDVFLPEIDNKKSKYDRNKRDGNSLIDNSKLAYLNTPRLNSFIRDFKKLCFMYGAIVTEFEDLGLESFTHEGVTFDGEIIYYEDVVDLLDEKHKIVDLSTDTDFKHHEKKVLSEKIPKIKVVHDPEVESLFTLKLENTSKNIFDINKIENEDDTLFSKEKWIIVLFAGYSGSDKIMLHNILELSSEYPKLNFAFKPYMDDDKMMNFSSVIEKRMRTPIILYKQDNQTRLLSSSILKKEEIKAVLNEI